MDRLHLEYYNYGYFLSQRGPQHLFPPLSGFHSLRVHFLADRELVFFCFGKNCNLMPQLCRI